MSISIDRDVKYKTFSKQKKNLVSFVPHKDLKNIPMNVREKNKLYDQKYTCNHTHEFKLDNMSRLWVRTIKFDSTNFSDSDKNWKVLFTPNDKRLVSVWSDGANLVVQDTNGKIFYRKCILDWREKGTRKYGWTDQLKAKEKKWKYIWAYKYSLHIGIDRITTLSHRGYWNHFSMNKKDNSPIYVDDPLGLHIGGNTCIYVLDNDHFVLYDPMAPFKIKFKIPKKLDYVHTTSSASTIFYVGYEPSDKNWEFYYKTSDFDTMGMVPHASVYKNVDSEWKQIKNDMNLDPQEWTLGGTKLKSLGDNAKELTVWWYNEKKIIKITSRSDKNMNFSNINETTIDF